jgi:signal transduction histidine kinase
MVQGEAERLPEIKKFTILSEQELNRIETLVQNLLEITKLDAGTIIIQKSAENIADMIKDIELHFAHRAKQERKEIVLSGADNITLFCDRDWIIEAISNIVKNALDHTGAGDRVVIEWKGLPDMAQITIKDTGSGIHLEDIHYIFKRFYRSRFSKDTQGIGLGLPLAKAIIEAHDGNITVDSELGKGSVFNITFLNSDKITKL